MYFVVNKIPGIAVYTVKETQQDGHKIYTVQLAEIKSAGTLPTVVLKRSSASADLYDVNISQLANQVNDASKVVDENGERLSQNMF